MGGGLVAAGAVLAFEKTRPHAVTMGAVAAIPTATTAMAEPSVGPMPEASATPTPPMLIAGGAAPRLSRENRLEAELAHVRSLLDQRARTADPTKRRALETEVRAASQRVVQLSPKPGSTEPDDL